MRTDAAEAGVRLDGITPENLSRYLARRFPDLVVTAVDIDRILPGTATKLRLCLRHDCADAPAVVWLKGGLEQHSEAFRDLYATESHFYREIAPRLGRHCADSYYASDGSDGILPLLLLEDLGARGVQFGDPNRPVTVETVQQALTLLARVHAIAWGDDALRSLPWLGRSDATFAALIDQWTEPAHWQTQLALPRGAAVPAGLRDDTGRLRTRRALQRMLERHAAALPCLIHGDAHVGNLFIDADDRVGYLDWQTARRGTWAHDVAECMTTALSPELRELHEAPLLRHYLAELTSQGIATPDFDAAWQAYRQALMWGFMWVLCPTQLQPEDVCVPNAQRACTALALLEVLSALEG